MNTDKQIKSDFESWLSQTTSIATELRQSPSTENAQKFLAQFKFISDILFSVATFFVIFAAVIASVVATIASSAKAKWAEQEQNDTLVYKVARLAISWLEWVRSIIASKFNLEFFRGIVANVSSNGGTSWSS